MALGLFKYFKVLPDSLSNVVDRGAIEAANEEVISVLDKGKGEVKAKPRRRTTPSVTNSLSSITIFASTREKHS